MIQETCNTCTQPAYSPFHRVDAQGKTIYGCIDAFHEASLVPCTEYAHWFLRPAAKKWRRDTAKRLKALLA